MTSSAENDAAFSARPPISPSAREELADIEPCMRRIYLRAYWKAYDEGYAKVLRRYVMRMLGARGIDFSDSVRTKVMSCGDTAQLEEWFDRTANAETLDEVFDPV